MKTFRLLFKHFLAVMVKERIPVRKQKQSVLSLLNLSFVETLVVRNVVLDTAQAKWKDDLPQKAPHPRKHVIEI